MLILTTMEVFSRWNSCLRMLHNFCFVFAQNTTVLVLFCESHIMVIGVAVILRSQGGRLRTMTRTMERNGARGCAECGSSLPELYRGAGCKGDPLEPSDESAIHRTSWCVAVILRSQGGRLRTMTHNGEKRWQRVC